MQTRTRARDTSQGLERAFAAAGLAAMLGTAAGGWVAAHGSNPTAVLGVACFALLVCAVVGIWGVDHARTTQRGAVARIYAQVLQTARTPGAERRRGREEPTRSETIADALRDVIRHARAAMWRRDGLVHFVADINAALSERRQQAERLAATLGSDAYLITDAATATRGTDAMFLQQMAAARLAASAAEKAATRLAEGAQELEVAVRGVTTQATRGTLVTARLGEASFASQRSVTAIGEATNAMLLAADQVAHVLQRAEMLDTGPGEESACKGDAAIAEEVKQLATTGRAALEAMLVVVWEVKQQAAEAFQRMQDVSDAIQAQHNFGQALSHAAMLQADGVGRLVQEISATRSGVVELHAHLRDVHLAESGRQGPAAAAQQAVERLPAYAEAMAQILRGLPDFGVVEKSSAE